MADALAILIYKGTTSFPAEKMFGRTSPLRRAAVSAASNIVEGCARASEAEYIHSLDIAYGSAREVEYQVGLAHRLGFLPEAAHDALHSASAETAKVLNGLLRALRPRP